MQNDRGNGDRSLIDDQRHPALFDENRTRDRNLGAAETRRFAISRSLIHSVGWKGGEEGWRKESKSRFPISGSRRGSRRIFFWLLGKGHSIYTRRTHYSKSSGEKYYRESEFVGDDGQREERERENFCIHRRGGQSNPVPPFRPCDKFASVDAGIEFPVA